MTYRPQESVFGPPFLTRLPSLLYMTVALVAVGVVLAGESSGSGTWLFNYVVVADKQRVLGIRTFAAILVCSALASVIRSSMRGVRIHPDGVEARDVLNWIMPKVSRYRWPQIECIVLDQRRSIALDLWDGTRTFLPIVGDHAGLASTLQQVATARAIPVKGGLPPDALFEEDEDFADGADSERAP